MSLKGAPEFPRDAKRLPQDVLRKSISSGAGEKSMSDFQKVLKRIILCNKRSSKSQ